MNDKEFNWKGHLKTCKDSDDYVDLFKKIRANKRARNEYLNYLRRRGNLQAINSIGKFKKKRHDRRKEIEKLNKEMSDKYKQTTLGGVD